MGCEITQALGYAAGCKVHGNQINQFALVGCVTTCCHIRLYDNCIGQFYTVGPYV